MELKLNDGKVSSLDLVNQINLFRRGDGQRKDLLHKNFLDVIRDEFSEEISELKLQPGSYKDQQNQDRPMFNLTPSQAKQVLVRESKTVRKLVIAYLERLEEELKSKQPKTYKEALLELVRVEEERERLELENKQQAEELDEKTNMLDGILDKLPVGDKRKILVKMVNKRSNNYRKAWNSAYSLFELTYGTNLQSLLNHNADKYKPRLVTKLDVIDRHLKELDLLFKIMVKTREEVVLEVVRELFPNLNLTN